MFPGTRIEDCATENTCHVNMEKIYSQVVNPYDETASPCRSAMRHHHLIHISMTQTSSRGGRRPKTDPSVNRYVVRFNAEENAKFLAMFDRSGLESRGAFIKNFIFQKPFKVYTIDENTRVFIDKLSSFNSLFRTLGISYDIVVKTLRENFTEKKAMSALYKLEKLTVELIKVNSEIVALAQKFDGQWSQKYQ